MIPLILDDSIKKLEADFLDLTTYPGVNPNSLLLKLFNLCEAFDVVVPLKKVEFSRPDLLVEHVYDYKFKSQDNRNWNQVITFLEWPDLNPKMTINTNNDAWKLSEFSLHRPIRDELIKLRFYNTLNRFKIVWS